MLRDVSELIDPATGAWDAELVHDIFWEEDARVILSTPVHSGMENRVAWHFDKKGVFAVKSAHKVFRNEQITHSRKDGARVLHLTRVLIWFGVKFGICSVRGRSNTFYGDCAIIVSLSG